MNMHSQLTESDAAQPYDTRLVLESDRLVWLARRWVRWAVLAVVFAAVAGALYLYLRPATPPAPPAASIPSVTVIVPGTSAVSDVITATGSIGARRDSPVGVQGEGGLVTAILAESGDFVRKGQVLARIDRSVAEQQAAAMAASIRQAKADAALAQAELDRAKQLVGKGFISKADIDRKTATRDASLARVGVAEAQFGEMQARLARLDIRAPEGGLVLARNVEVGQVVGPASGALFRIAEGGSLEMRAKVAEQDMARLRPGMGAAVLPVGATTPVQGKIWLIEPVIEVQSRQGIARILLPYSPDLRVGAFGSATIRAGEAARPLLPQSAVQVDENGSYVYVITPDNKVVRRGITIGEVKDEGVAIARGLDGSERVVATAAAFLKPGETVTPVLASGRKG